MKVRTATFRYASGKSQSDERSDSVFSGASCVRGKMNGAKAERKTNQNTSGQPFVRGIGNRDVSVTTAWRGRGETNRGTVAWELILGECTLWAILPFAASPSESHRQKLTAGASC